MTMVCKRIFKCAVKFLNIIAKGLTSFPWVKQDFKPCKYKSSKILIIWHHRRFNWAVIFIPCGCVSQSRNGCNITGQKVWVVRSGSSVLTFWDHILSDFCIGIIRQQRQIVSSLFFCFLSNIRGGCDTHWSKKIQDFNVSDETDFLPVALISNL